MHTDVAICSKMPNKFYLADDGRAGLKVEEDFIFGLLHDKLDSVELPLCVEVVEKSRWEMAN